MNRDLPTLAVRRAFFREELRELVSSEDYQRTFDLIGCYGNRARERMLVQLLEDIFLMGVILERKGSHEILPGDD